MDYFSLCLNTFCLAGQSSMQMAFVSRLTEKKQKLWHFPVYFLLLCAMEWLFTRIALPGSIGIGIEVLALYCVSRFMLGNQRPASWIAAIFAVYISQLSFGIVNSVEAMLFPDLVGKSPLYGMLVLATVTVFVICGCCYMAILKCLSLAEDGQMPYCGLLLLPGVFFFAAELYILQTAYGSLPDSLSLEAAGKHSALLFLQILGLAALLCTVYAYGSLCRSFQSQAALQALAQAAEAQKGYITELQMRYQQTKAFRHDVKNHLTVLEGLLRNEKLEESKAYLQKLELTSNTLSFPYQTGNGTLDVLLGEKLGMAKAAGILTEVSVILPRRCGIDDFDLCVIFANALDNAMNACRAMEGERERWIRLRGQQQGNFYMLAFENSCLPGPMPPMGTGLSNMKSAAEKYGGTILVEKKDKCFSFHVLLDIS